MYRMKRSQVRTPIRRLIRNVNLDWEDSMALGCTTVIERGTLRRLKRATLNTFLDSPVHVLLVMPKLIPEHWEKWEDVKR
uniref:Putative uncharacterized protein encoded by LINC01545 n=1 Tax=Homo sapiens TaxID=9606 RepID=CX031_HUMAN|nr:RecName: Full=Putative uncharacterized protein encoded by LINC01545 [Homo sapiens]